MNKVLAILLTPLFFVSACATSDTIDAPPSEAINVTCKSPSGKSIYDLMLNLKDAKGSIRYRFMEQDVYYHVNMSMQNNKLVSGKAYFYRSNSGETKGNSFTFLYNKRDNTFEENGLISKCN